MAKPAPGKPRKAQPKAVKGRPKKETGISRWRKLITAIPGGISSIVGSIIALGAAIGVIYSFWPATLDLALSCEPNKMVLTVTNRGGQAAYVLDPTFTMISTVRFHDTGEHEIHMDAFENPFERPDARTIGPGLSKSYPWEGFIYDDDMARGAQCQILVRVPLANPQGEYPGGCSCRRN